MLRSFTGFRGRLPNPAFRAMDRKNYSSPFWRLRPYAGQDHVTSKLNHLLVPGLGMAQISVMGIPALSTLIYPPIYTLATAAVVMPAAYVCSKILNSPIGEGMQSAFQGVLWMLSSFAPPLAYENLLTELSASLAFLFLTVFTFQLFPEIILKDYLVLWMLAFFFLPIFPLAFSYAPSLNTRAFLTL